MHRTALLWEITGQPIHCCTALPCTVLYYINHYTALHYTPLQLSTLNYNKLYFPFQTFRHTNGKLMAKEAIYTFGLITFAISLQIKGKYHFKRPFKSGIKKFSVVKYFLFRDFFPKGKQSAEGKQSAAQQTFAALLVGKKTRTKLWK